MISTQEIRVDRSRSVAMFLLASLGALVAIALGIAAGRYVAEPIQVLALIICAAAGGSLLWFGGRNMTVYISCVLAFRASLDGFSELIPIGDGLPATMLSLFTLGYGAWWLAEQRSRKEPILRSSLGIAMVLLVVACGLSALGANLRSTSMQDVARLASAVVVLLIVQQVVASGAHRARLIVSAVMLSALVPLIVGAVQLATGQTSVGGRVYGTFGHPNAFGFYLVLIVLLCVLARAHTDGNLKLGVDALLIISAIELVFTYSRSAYLAVGIGLAVISFFRTKWILVGLVATMVLVPIAVPSVADRINTVEEEAPLVGTGNNSLLWRLQFWQEVLTLAKGNEVFGIGFGMTRYEAEESLPPHNDFLRLYVESGVVGELAFLAVVGGLVVTARRGIRRVDDPLERDAGVLLLSTTAAYVVFSVGGNLISIPAVLWYFFAMAGGVAGLVYRNRIVDVREQVVVPKTKEPAPVTCVIPTHGRTEHLGEAIESIQQQSRLPREVIVVDDLDDPATRAAVEGIAVSSPFVVMYVANTEGSGASSSRNLGARLATFPYLAFLDDDDCWAPGFIEQCFGLLQAENKNAAIGALWRFKADGVIPLGVPRIDLAAREVLATNPIVTGSNLLVDVSAFHALGGFDESLPVSNDKDFFFRFLDAGYTYSVIDRPLAFQRAHTSAGGRLTDASARRVNGLKLYRSKWDSRLSTRDRRLLDRNILRNSFKAEKRSVQRAFLALTILLRFGPAGLKREEPKVWQLPPEDAPRAVKRLVESGQQ